MDRQIDCAAGEHPSGTGADPNGRLLRLAQEAARRLLSEHPVLPNYENDLSVLLVGSLGMGFADEFSDIDLWVLCSDSVSESMSEQFAQNGLRFDSLPPHTFTHDGADVHHFTFPLSKLEHSLELHDDGALYAAKHCAVYRDANNQFAALSARFADLPSAVVRDKIADAYSWVRINAGSLQEQLRRYQPSCWLRCTGALVHSALKLGCWLDGEIPASEKWAFRQVQSCSTAPILLPAINGLLRSTGIMLDSDSTQSDGTQIVSAAAAALDSAARRALDAAGYDDIPTPTLRKIG